MKLKTLILLGALTASPAFAWNNQPPLDLNNYQEDAYGPGLNSANTGQPFRWETQDGQALPPNTRVEPGVYGPNTGMDEYGRPVQGVGQW